MADDVVSNKRPQADPTKDPTSPYYIFHPEHPRLADTIPSSITTPKIGPQLPYPIAYVTGFDNRRNFMSLAMAARGEPALGRPLTPVEAAVLTRYTQIMRNGGEWAGFLGLVSAAAIGMRTDSWPMEGIIRSALGMRPRNSEGSSLSSNSTASSSSATATANAASSGSEAVAAAETTATQKPKWTFQAWAMKQTADDPQMGPKAFQEIMKKKGELYRQLVAYPPERRADMEYRMLWSSYKHNLSLERDFTRAQLDMQEKVLAQAREALKLSETMSTVETEKDAVLDKSLAKHVEKLKVVRDETKVWVEEVSAAVAAMEARQEIKPVEVNPSEIKPVEINPSEIKPSEIKPRQQPRLPPPPPPATRLTQFFSGDSAGTGRLYGVRDIFRVLTWAWVGKYIGSTVGLIFIISRSRRLEAEDERLQEYQYDRKEYAKQKAQHRETTLPKPAAQPTPIERPKSSDGGRGGGREDTRYQETDTQSLGGLQAESIDWGDFKTDEAPAPAQRVPSPRPGESSWERARREREGPQQPAMHEDSWAPQEQQDRAVSTAAGSSSTWERIREQASEAYGGGKRIPGESRVDETPTGESAWSRLGQQAKPETPKSREELQREFDAELDKEWKGGK
ncbi:hypothetical protein TWF694_009153 [Orbilia ellipsospora]|uniref:Uncharacterized protein n=1 Tax=Orbilia ellipsospora TaxID=2528407 RepID=A0AAV9XFJ9_9PEZI